MGKQREAALVAQQSAATPLEVLEAEAANEVQGWLERPGVRELFRNRIAAWCSQQQELSDTASTSPEHFGLKRPLTKAELPVEYNKRGFPVAGLSRAGPSRRWKRLPDYPIVDGDTPPELPQPKASADQTCSLGEWSGCCDYVLLAVLHDRVALKRGGRWQPVVTDSDFWPAFLD